MGLDLAFSVTGDGPPLIILHGLFGWKRNWAGIAKALQDDYRVYTLDLRNHGESPHGADMSYPDMADDVARFIDTQRLFPVRLVGHSMGGKTAMTLALTAPGMIDRLTIVDIAPVTYARDYDHYIRALQAVDVKNATRRSDIENSLAQEFPDRSVRAFLLQNLVKYPTGEYGWRVNLDAISGHMGDIMGFPATPDAHGYPGQTLFLGGRQSDYIAPAHRSTIDRLFPHAEIDYIEGAGHWVHADQPVAFVKRLQSFLTS